MTPLVNLRARSGSGSSATAQSYLPPLPLGEGRGEGLPPDAILQVYTAAGQKRRTSSTNAAGLNRSFSAR